MGLFLDAQRGLLQKHVQGIIDVLLQALVKAADYAHMWVGPHLAVQVNEAPLKVMGKNVSLLKRQERSSSRGGTTERRPQSENNDCDQTEMHFSEVCVLVPCHTHSFYSGP